VRNVTVFCHNLTVEGELNATADCSGTLTFKRSGRITGKVNCMKLVVNSSVSLVFEKTVRAVEAEIHGNVTANFQNCEKITLHKKATLEGSLITKALEVFPGGTHTGPAKVG